MGWIKISLVLLLLVALFVAVFREQFYDFFFSPDGLSIAPSEICLVNMTSKELYIEVDTYVGAKAEGLLYADEKLCAPSPNNEVVGKVKAGFAENLKILCEFDVKKSGDVVLKSITKNGSCDWELAN